MKRIIIVLLLIIIINIGYISTLKLSKSNIEQKVLFEVGYENWAWGYQKHGVFIDNEGNIKSYDVDKPDNWNYPSNDGYISKEKLEENFNKTDSTIRKINKFELVVASLLIKPASKEWLTKDNQQGADQGDNNFSCYLFDKSTNQYKEIFISSSGDHDIRNLNPFSLILELWLRIVL